MRCRALSCPLCESEQAAGILRSRNGYDILRCTNCSLVFTDDRTAPSADRLYPQFDQSGTAFAKGAGSALKIFLRQRESFIRRLKPSGRLLDFGCGNGAFAQHMSMSGFDTVGVEPFSLGATQTADRLKLIRAPFEQIAGELGSFDIITLWQVLEHLSATGRGIAAPRDASHARGPDRDLCSQFWQPAKGGLSRQLVPPGSAEARDPLRAICAEGVCQTSGPRARDREAFSP